MIVLRTAVHLLLLVGLLAGCSLYGVDYRLWHKANASNDDLKSALDACGQHARAGSVEASSDPRTYFQGPVTPEQTSANRLFQRCMVTQGWWPLQPPLQQAAEKGPSASLAPSTARSTYREYASRAVVGRRLASGPF